LRRSLAEGFDTLADTMGRPIIISHSGSARGIASLETFASVEPPVNFDRTRFHFGPKLK
jgi:hypothetical protein